MINNNVVIFAIQKGAIRSGYVVILDKDTRYLSFRCKIIKIIPDGNSYIVKLKTGKDYPLGHKIIYRSLEELL